MEQTPIMVLSDSVDQTSGLSRIARDLCTLLIAQPEWRVASLGHGGMGSRTLPWTQYVCGLDEYGHRSLPYAWTDFAGEQGAGIVFTIHDPSRLLWLAHPQYVEDEFTRNWLLAARKRRFKVWSYLPVDATGPRNRLTAISREVLIGIDRLLAYSPWAEGVIRNTIGSEEAEKRGLSWMPHGLNLRTFAPLAISNKDTRVNTCTRDAQEAVELMDGQAVQEEVMLIETESVRHRPVTVEGAHGASVETSESTHSGSEDDSLPKRIGIVATNQARKDFGMMGVVMAALVERLVGNVRFWIHTDQLIRHWSIPAIIADFGLGEYVEVTQPPMTDGEMAERLRACDLTLHPGSEGFGYPIFESLACGVPVLHGDYAGGASLMSTCGLARYLVQPVAWRLEGQHNCLRPVYEPADWVNAAIDVLSIKPDAAWLASRVAHLSWMKLGWPWKRWLREGIGNENR